MARPRTTPAPLVNRQPICTHKKKNGEPCKAPALAGKTCCTFHSAEHKLAVQRGRVEGGSVRAPSTLPADTPPLPLATAGDVLTAMAECYNLIRVGKLGVREGNALALIGGTLLRAVEARQLESELDDLRKQVNEIAGNRGRVRR